MTDPLRLVIDTNVLISGALALGSLPAGVLDFTIDHGQLLLSVDMLDEYHSTLFASKFDRYLSQEVRTAFLRDLLFSSEWSEHVPLVEACRDPRDDKVLSLAVATHADFIVTGDSDLLDLHPFRGVQIATPRAFHELVGELRDDGG